MIVRKHKNKTAQLPRPFGAGTGRPLRIGHMGAGGLAPGNSRASIEAALRNNVDLVELDVWRTADGHFVLSHLNWIAPAHGPEIGRLQQLRSLRSWRRWPRVTQGTLESLQALAMPPLSLIEALDALRGRAIPYLDLRFSDGAEDLAALLRRAAPDGVVLGSGPFRDFHRETALLPGTSATLGMGVPFFGRALSDESLARLAHAMIRLARRRGADGLSMHYHLLRPAFLNVCRQEGVYVFAWTVDDPAAMRRLIALGVDGITTNRPDRLAAIHAR